MKKIIPVFLGILLFLNGCVNDMDVDGERPDTLPRELTASEQKVIGSGQSFSYDIFRRVVTAEEKENVFISPLSISMALGMTVNGASGDTRTAMKEALYMEEMDIDEINKSYQSLVDLLINLDPEVQMKIANSIWSREGFEVKEAFIEECRKYFNAEVSELNFDDPKAADIINDWVSKNTEGLIEKIIDGGIPQEVVMYLINAIYFKGDWLYEFDPEDTRERDFNLENGNVATVDMMEQKTAVAAYLSDQVNMIDLPYGDSLYTMTLLMPADPGVKIDDFIRESLTSQNMAAWRSNMKVSNRVVGLPKFKMEYKKSLNDILKEMGMGVAFEPFNANFKNINENGDLFISDVKHKTFVEVNEEGTEAAAVTSVSIGVTSVGPSQIIFDRPFVFMIRERISGTVLFMGKMKNPDTA